MHHSIRKIEGVGYTWFVRRLPNAGWQGWFGDTDAAIAVRPHLLQAPNGLNHVDLRLDVHWDPLRKDPRFQRLLADSEKSGATKTVSGFFDDLKRRNVAILAPCFADGSSDFRVNIVRLLSRVSRR